MPGRTLMALKLVWALCPWPSTPGSLLMLAGKLIYGVYVPHIEGN